MIQYLNVLFNAKFNRDERGATAVEYGLLVALIAAIIVAVVVLLGQNILEGFTDTNTAIENNDDGGAPAAP
jgi:pilus assembly protein Flp/PilA